MALFRYEYFTPQGKRAKGIIDADSPFDAKERLKLQKITAIGLFPFVDKRSKIKIPSSILLSFTRELSQLIRAGLPLYEALLTLEEKHRGQKFHLLFLDLCDQIKNGCKLSKVLESYPSSFDQIYLSMIKAGEESGALGEVLEQLYKMISRAEKIKKQLFSSLAYPLFLTTFCLIVVLCLLLFMIPSMKDLFEGRELKWITRTVLSLSRLLEQNAGLLFSLFLFFLGSLFFLFRIKSFQQFCQRISLKIPIINMILVRASLIRFCRSMSLLLTSGVPLLQALSLSKRVMRHFLFEELVSRAEKKVSEGKLLSEELKNSILIPPLVTRMLSLAEETGQSPIMLSNIAEIYEEELEKVLNRITTLIQPIMLLILGFIVAIVVLSVLLPLTDVSSFTT